MEYHPVGSQGDLLEGKDGREGLCFAVKQNILSEGICPASDLVEYGNSCELPRQCEVEKKVRFWQFL